MPTMQRSGLLFAAGGDVLAKYGTLTRRYQIPQLGGEGGKEVFARAGTAWAVGKNGLLVPYAANVPRVEYAIDPVTLVQQPYLLLEAAGTNLIENSDYEVDAVGSVVIGGSTLTRDATNAFNGAWGLKVTVANGSASGMKWTNRDTTRIAAVAGTTYTLSVPVFAPAASVGKQMRLSIEWYDAGAALLATSQVGAPVLVAGWQRLTFTAAAPANTVTAIPYYLTHVAAQGIFDTWTDVPQFEARVFATSPIATGVGAVIRNADTLTVPWYISPGATWFYLRFLERGAVTIGAGECFQIGTFPGRVLIQGSGGKYRLFRDTIGGANVATSNGPTPNFGDVVELLGLLNPDGSVAFRSSLNNGAEVVATPGGPLALDATWAAPLRLQLGGGGDGPQPLALSRFLVGTGPGTAVATIADARAIPV